ncbi:MAG: hypothetical protein EAZ95_10785 [Bacteroidetes bacterium]|nr:MAG: hypothetical protein EAZ95_10785 [Bacteroidota bacterium]
MLWYFTISVFKTEMVNWFPKNRKSIIFPFQTEVCQKHFLAFRFQNGRFFLRVFTAPFSKRSSESCLKTRLQVGKHNLSTYLFLASVSNGIEEKRNTQSFDNQTIIYFFECLQLRFQNGVVKT